MAEGQEIDVSHRKLEELDCTQYPELRVLNAAYNKLTSTDGLLQCYQLTRLSLAHNYLGKLEGWYCFEHLTYLDLSYNQLVTVSGLRNCFKLKHLQLQHNLLKTLEGLEAMHALETLNLAHNWLAEVASSIRLLTLNKNLHTLWLEGNPLEGYKQACWSQLDSLTILDDEFTPPSNFRARQPGRNSYSVNMSKAKRGLDLYRKHEQSLSQQEQIFINRLKQPKSRPQSQLSSHNTSKVGLSLLSIKSPPVISPSAHLSDRELDLEKFMETPLDVLMKKDLYQHPMFVVPNLSSVQSGGREGEKESPKSVHFSPRIEQFTVDSYDPFESDRRSQTSSGMQASDSHRSLVEEAVKSASLSETDITEYISLLQEKKRLLESLKTKGS